MHNFVQILAHVNDSPDAETVLALAALLAADQDSALAAVYAVDPLPIGPFVTPETVAIGTTQIAQQRRARRDQAQALVARVVPTQVLQFESEGPLAALTRRSRSTDLIVMAQPQAQTDTGHAAHVAERVLLAAACPLLITPHRAPTKEALSHVGRRILVAWSPTRECARAMHEALPLLQRALAVELLHLGANTPEVSAGLDATQAHWRRHGVASTRTVRQAHVPSAADRLQGDARADVHLSQTLLAHASEQEMDLIVMGGYSRPRALERVLGGLTQAMFKSATVPVFMAH